MYEIYHIYTGHSVERHSTKDDCWEWIDAQIDAEDYDVRLVQPRYKHLFHEDNGPEWESMNEMEKYQ